MIKILDNKQVNYLALSQVESLFQDMALHLIQWKQAPHHIKHRLNHQNQVPKKPNLFRKINLKKENNQAQK